MGLFGRPIPATKYSKINFEMLEAVPTVLLFLYKPSLEMITGTSFGSVSVTRARSIVRALYLSGCSIKHATSTLEFC